MEYSKLLLAFCILMSSCGILCVSSSSFDMDLTDYLGKMASGDQSFTCMEKLMPCQPFLVPGPAPPPANCCIPLKELIANDTKCVCDTFNNPLVMGSLNVTMDDVMKLPKACNETFDINVCKTAGAGDAKGGSDTNSSASASSTPTLNSDSTPDTDSDDSTPDSDSPPDSNSDSTPDSDSKASGANGKFSSSSGREYILSIAFFVAFIVSVY